MTRLDLVTVATAIAAGLAAVAFTWQPGLASLFDDSVSYLLAAQAAAPYGDAPPAVLAAARLEKYPPLMGWLIAFSGGAFDWRIAHAVVGAAFGMSVLLLGLHARAITASAAVGLGAALVYAVMPGAWLNVKGILSEFPYMALTFAALALHAWRGAVPLSRLAAILLGLLLAASLLARTIGAALIAAIAVSELVVYLRDRDGARLRGLAIAIAIPVIAAALWYALRPAAGEDAYAASGSAGRFALDMAAANASALRDAWLNAMLALWGEPWKPGYVMAMAVGALGLAAGAWRALRGDSDGLYVVFFLAILVAWPWPGQMFQLALPIVPLVLVHFLWGVVELLDRMRHVTVARWSPYAALLPLAVCAPATFFHIVPRASADEMRDPGKRVSEIAEFYRIPARQAAEQNAVAQIAMFEDLRRIGRSTPQEARVMWYAPGYIALLAQRHGARLERPRDAGDLARQALAAKADHIFLGELHPRDGARRDGHPLDPLATALSLGRPVWHRATGGSIQSALVRLDRAKVEAAARQPVR